MPISQDNRCLGAKPSSSLSILNGGVELLSNSPLSLSPIESPLATGSFLEQRARMLFRHPGHSPEEGAVEGAVEEAELGEGMEPTRAIIMAMTVWKKKRKKKGKKQAAYTTSTHPADILIHPFTRREVWPRTPAPAYRPNSRGGRS